MLLFSLRSGTWKSDRNRRSWLRENRVNTISDRLSTYKESSSLICYYVQEDASTNSGMYYFICAGFICAALKAGICNPETENEKPEISTIRENYNNLPNPCTLCYNPHTQVFNSEEM